MSLPRSSSARAQQHATRAAFFIPGFATALWAVLVPFAKHRTAVDDGALGLILLCLGAGSLLAMPIAGAATPRFGSRALMIVTTVVICVSLPALALVSSPWALALALFAFGAGVGAMDCAMNMQAVVIERDAGRAMMSGFHAFYSIGGFAGAAAMLLLLGAGGGPLPAVIAATGGIALVALASARHWRSQRLPAGQPTLAWPRGIVLFIGALAFVVFLAEGAMLDWSSVFLSEVRGLPPANAGIGYLLLTLTMTITRLFGDPVVQRLGRVPTIVIGALLAAVGLLLLTVITPWQLSLPGYVLLGLGCANIVPALFSLAGSQTRMPESVAITAVTTLGYAGILAGPALIGFVAHAVGLPAAFIAVALLLIGVAASARWLKH